MPDRFTVFISHKGEDSNTAEILYEALRAASGDTVTYFLSERIKHGQNWLDELHNSLQQSKYLLLIYTDPKEDWSWCMYEAGYFAALRSLQQIRGRQIFCLHHADVPAPGPLAHLQATKVTHDRVRQFITTFFGDNEIKTSPEQENEIVKTVTSCFAHRDTTPYIAHRLALIVNDKHNIDPLADLVNALPEGSYFRGSEESLISVFQRRDDTNKLSWRLAVDASRSVARLNNNLEQFDVKWLTEIVDVLYRVSLHFSPPQRPVRGLVFTGASEIIYSPVIYEISEHRTGRLSCEIVFLAWDGNQYPKAPEHIRQLMTATRVAVRFRQEFLEEFKGLGENARLQAGRGRSAAHNFRGRVWRAFYEVMTESTHRGLTTMSLGAAFGEQGRHMLVDITTRFLDALHEFTRILGAPEDLSTSIVAEKEIEFEEEEFGILDEIYQVFDEHNAKFLAMAIVAVEGYFMSLVSRERWKRLKHEVVDAAP